MIRYLLPLILLLACEDPNRQDIDLSDRVVERPSDGVGHYVYALSLPRTVAPGEEFEVQMEWRTVGSVDPNARYQMDVILKGETDEKVYSIPAAANTVGELHLANWLSYEFEVPENFPAGEYTLGIRLRDALDDSAQPDLFVPLGYRRELDMADGFSRLASLAVALPEPES